MPIISATAGITGHQKNSQTVLPADVQLEPSADKSTFVRYLACKTGQYIRGFSPDFRYDDRSREIFLLGVMFTLLHCLFDTRFNYFINAIW